MVGEANRIFPFKQQVTEELQAQHVYTALVSSPPVVASSSHISGDKEGTNSIASIELGAWLMPLLSIAVRVHINIKWFPLVEKETTKFDDWPLELGPHFTGAEARTLIGTRSYQASAPKRGLTDTRSYRRCFVLSLQDLEVYKRKPIHIQLEDYHHIFWRPYRLSVSKMIGVQPRYRELLKARLIELSNGQMKTAFLGVDHDGKDQGCAY